MHIFNKQLNPKIIEELEYLNEKYFLFDEPVPFVEGLTIYPVLVKDYNEFMVCSRCCQLNKNEDINGITMTHLEYLYNCITKSDEGSILGRQFSRLIELVFRIQNGVKCSKCGKVFSYEEYLKKATVQKLACDQCGGEKYKPVIRFVTDATTNKLILLVNDIIIDSANYDRFRQIVMYQNYPDYKDDSWVNPEIKADQEERMRLEHKGDKTLQASLEKKIVCVSSQTSYTFEQLYNFTIRKFIMLLTTVDDVINYQIMKLASMTGLVKIDNVEHWIYKPEATMYKEAVDANSYVDKINSAGS